MIQYASNLLSSEQLVLRADRDRGDNPMVEVYSLPSEFKLLLKILGDVNVETMQSNPNAGAKSRSDFYFAYGHLDALINIIEPFIKTISVKFDDSPRITPDPTGMEHSDGIPLGYIYNQQSTNFVATCEVNYSERFCATTTSKLYIEPELKRGQKLHFGITMSENISKSTDNSNYFKVYIEYKDVKRLLHSVKNAKVVLEN